MDSSVLNVSDHNEIDVQDIWAEIESVNGENTPTGSSTNPKILN